MTKKLLFILFCIICAADFAVAKKNIKDNPADIERLNQAVALYDDGEYESALAEYEKLLKTYPDNYVIGYERAMALYRLKRYEDVVKVAKKLIKNKDVTPLAYQIYGNALDILRKPNEALQIYDKGIKIFPDAGMLYLEKGNVYTFYKKPEWARKSYNMGIEADPNFASNYYRGAYNYFDSEEKVWGLIYAEAQCMLNVNNEGRRQDMIKALIECLKNNVVQQDSTISVTLNKSVTIVMDSTSPPGDCTFRVTVPGIIEGCYARAITRFHFEDEIFNPDSFESITKLRRYVVDAYYDKTDNYYGNGLYLLEYQKKIIDAGFWEAYNYFLFADVLEYDCEVWNLAHPGEYDRFVDWYNDGNIFRLGEGRTVGVLSSLNQITKTDLLTATLITSELTKPYGASKTDEAENED